jgi:hypothetical protein
VLSVATGLEEQMGERIRDRNPFHWVVHLSGDERM